MTGTPADFDALRRAADSALARPGCRWRRALVLEACASTQDAALEACAGEPGLVVVAARQTSGRGRLGRAWHDESGLGLALTCVLPAGTGAISLASGVGVLRAVSSLGVPRIGIKWPNDAVERDGLRRKLAGVLIEVNKGVALLGVGLNVLQRGADWPGALHGRAVSLRELGLGVTRAAALVALLASLDDALLSCESPEGLRSILAQWAAADVLTGTEQEFEHNNTRVRGIVRSIDPLRALVVATPSGDVSLPASSTSLVKQ
ncbi:MAG: biotin--[acetyl-CoA-carboxylase] ligase [Phycisphaerales bacterium]